ncbi:MAG: VOC family protein [Rikenellaceae bacterium]
MKKILLLLLACCSLAAASAQTVPPRPKIVNVAHGGFFTKDYHNTRQLFKDFFGFGEPVIMVENGKELFTFAKINDDQYIEIFPERQVDANRMYHFAVETEDAEAMRLYLKAVGWEAPENTPKGRTRNSNYFIKDTNGTICEFVQYEPDGMTTETAGQFMSEDRISKKLSHIGFVSPDLDKSVAFYVDVLGFKEIWRGGPTPDKVTCVHLQVPEGDSFIEIMLCDTEPTWEQMCELTHIAFEVEDIDDVKAILSKRTLPKGCKGTGEIEIGLDNKRRLNYYNVDGTRIELVEAKTVDGKAVPSSKGTPLTFASK